MTHTKITVKVIGALNKRLNDNMRDCFMKRDQFVAHLIHSQLNSLEKCMVDKRLSRKAKQYISNSIKRADTRIVNITIEQSVADRLNAIVEKSNLVRDALINRILFFAVVNERVLDKMGIPTKLEDVSSLSNYGSTLPLSPIGAIQEILSDPLFYVKEAFKLIHDESIFLYSFNNLKFKGINNECFSCYLDDFQVPGTSAHEDLQDIERLLGSLFTE